MLIFNESHGCHARFTQVYWFIPNGDVRVSSPNITLRFQGIRALRVGSFSGKPSTFQLGAVAGSFWPYVLAKQATPKHKPKIMVLFPP